MSALSDGIDAAASIIGGLIKMVPAVASWIKPAVDAQPDHPLSRAVAEKLPEHSKSEAALHELEK